MKLVVYGFLAIGLACGALAAAQESADQSGEPISVLRLPSPVSEDVVLQEPAAPVPADHAVPAEVVMGAPVSGGCCDPCCAPRCVPTTFCLVDPCGCSHEACVKVPACCVGQQPNICWKDGVLGRQVATLCFECCDFEAKVIVTRNGNVRVRDRS